jgi:hypothetical protein
MKKLTSNYVMKVSKNLGHQMTNEQCNSVLLEYPDWYKLNPNIRFSTLVRNIIYFILE